MDKIINNTRYLVHPANEHICLRIAKDASPEQIAVSRRRLEWLATHPGVSYPADLQREMAAVNLRLPKTMKKNPATEPLLPLSPARRAANPARNTPSPSRVRSRSRSPLQQALEIRLERQESLDPKRLPIMDAPPSPVTTRSPYPLSRPMDTSEEHEESDDYGVFEALPASSEPGPSANGMLYTILIFDLWCTYLCHF